MRINPLPPYWKGKTERLFTRMHQEIRIALLIASRAEKTNPRDILEESIVSFIASGDFDTVRRYHVDDTYQGCTHRIDTGVADQLRLVAKATGESIQTIIHEALNRRLSSVPKVEEKR